MTEDNLFPIVTTPLTEELCPSVLLEEVALAMRSISPAPLSSHVWYGIDQDDQKGDSGRLIFTIRGIRLANDPHVLEEFARYVDRPVARAEHLKLPRPQFVPYPERGVLPTTFLPEHAVSVYSVYDHQHSLARTQLSDETRARMGSELNVRSRSATSPQELADVVGGLLQFGFDGSAFAASDRLLELSRGSLEAQIIRMVVLDRLCLHEAALWRGTQCRMRGGDHPLLLLQLAVATGWTGELAKAAELLTIAEAGCRANQLAVPPYQLQGQSDLQALLAAERRRLAETVQHGEAATG